MSFTLQQLINITGDKPLVDEVLFTSKIDMSLKVYANQLKTGLLSVSDLPQFSLFNPTESQAEEWCKRILYGSGMSREMMVAVCSDPGIEVDDIDSSDAVIMAAAQYQICAYMVQISY